MMPVPTAHLFMRHHPTPDFYTRCDVKVVKDHCLAAIRRVRKARCREIREFINERIAFRNKFWLAIGCTPVTFKQMKKRFDDDQSLCNQLEWHIGIKQAYSSTYAAAHDILAACNASTDSTIFLNREAITAIDL